jgi:hypothetical protein
MTRSLEPPGAAGAAPRRERPSDRAATPPVPVAPARQTRRAPRCRCSRRSRRRKKSAAVIGPLRRIGGADASSSHVPAAQPAASYLVADRTALSWLLTTDHKRIGVLYLFTVSFFLALGGVFALALRLEHLTPGPGLMTAMTYDRLFTLHGVTMVWLFMIPSIPAAFGNFFLPIMIGAKDVAFPRLNLLSYWI